jgi:haloalkane dehalogenase
MTAMLPNWLDRELYPFAQHAFRVDAGSMNYVDEGPTDDDASASPIVLVHGNPSWSFQFRGLIERLSPAHRCIAPDHLGFGLSDKPESFSYLPEDHARNLDRLLESLDLRDITLVVNDWGGPIGLSYALNHLDRVARLVITNTWMWPVNDDWYYRGFSGFMGGPLGRTLIRRRNFFAQNVVKMAFGTKSRLTPEIHRHYTAPLGTQEERKGSWVFPGQIIGATPWLRELWDRREAIADKPALLAWGMKDIAFREKELKRWEATLHHARTIRFADTGHFVSEEVPGPLADAIAELIAGG